MYILGKKSRLNLEGVHSDLVLVIAQAIQATPLDFAVTEGVRTLERQKRLFNEGASKTLDSRHLSGHAVDLAVIIDGQITWNWPVYNELAEIIKEVAKQAHIPLEWGGDWKNFLDGPHYQLPKRNYP